VGEREKLEDIWKECGIRQTIVTSFRKGQNAYTEVSPSELKTDE
jgi:hypothetical protein